MEAVTAHETGLMMAIFGLVLIVMWALRFVTTSSWFIGVIGERRVHSFLRRKLNRSDYQIFVDVILPTQDGGTTQIDHVVISRFGVFVIETKNMGGWIYGNDADKIWTQTFRQQKYKFQNPKRQNLKHIKVLQTILGVKPSCVFGAVVFVGSATPKTAMPLGVVWGIRELASYIKLERRELFTDDECNKLGQVLRSKLIVSNRKSRRQHIKYVSEKSKRKEAKNFGCPKCGSHLVERMNSKTGDKFLGCSRFPKCRGSRKFTL